MLRPALCVLLLALTVACAGTPSEPRYAERAATAKKNCVTTGSHIKTKQGNCSPGRSYSSSSEVQRTGAAVPVLNPTVDPNRAP